MDNTELQSHLSNLKKYRDLLSKVEDHSEEVPVASPSVTPVCFCSFTVSVDLLRFESSPSQLEKFFDFSKELVCAGSLSYDGDQYEFFALDQSGLQVLVLSYKHDYKTKVRLWNWHTEEVFLSLEFESISLEYEWDHEHLYSVSFEDIHPSPNYHYLTLYYGYTNEFSMGLVVDLALLVNLDDFTQITISKRDLDDYWTLDDMEIVSANQQKIKFWVTTDEDAASKLMDCQRSLEVGEYCDTDELVSDHDWSSVSCWETTEVSTADLTALGKDEFGYLITGHENGKIRVWDEDDPNLITTLESESSPVTCIDCKAGILAIGHKNGKVCLWNASEQSLIATFQAHQLPVSCVKLQANGQILVSEDEEHLVKVWVHPEQITEIETIQLTQEVTMSDTMPDIASSLQSPEVTPISPKLDVSQLQVGDYISEMIYYQVKKVNSKTVILLDQRGEEVKVDKSLLANAWSANQYHSEELVNRHELNNILVQVGHHVFTAHFTKQPKDSDIKKKLLDALRDAEGNYLEPKNAEKNLKKISKSLLEGEERILTGYFVKVNPGLGRSLVIDLEVADDKNRLRQIDHRTINWIIFKGIKYIVK